MFNKVLIANRGAIAVRIERTLRRLGIASVAVYTKADQDSLHVDGADEAVLIGEGPARDSYLDAELILRVAQQTGAQAIHPGYGFLSENAEFARACRERGIVFIGPTPEQMELFGLKHSAREIAERAGVPLLPGTALLAGPEEAAGEAGRIGYPVILKSTAGGGGIGMRVCEDERALRAAFESVRHLAESNFRNGGVFLEKYVARARHVEVQIFGNSHGEVAALGERDCSIQRRNQKVIEESPAPDFPAGVRADMLAAAKRLAAEAGYRSAGTVEFLYDPETRTFYFLEVNTRLQVEHGVTEEVLGIDLVEWMVREAEGGLAGLDELFGEPAGHSIQARIYAEDCLQEFRPSAGQLDRAVLPEGARVETWVRDGMQLTTLYDPMLAKIIVRGADRAEAVRKLAEALDRSRFYGITTNLQYLQALLADKDVLDGRVHTRMLNGFAPQERALEVLDGGVQTTVQDWPGRTGHWDVGVPPCGPMDAYSLRIGNALLGNDSRAPGLELTLRGGSFRFRSLLRFCLTGADMGATLDDRPVPMYTPIDAGSGQVLTFGEPAAGMRAYLLVEGGFDMPLTLGSASTFTLGGFGGHGGRALRIGDVLRVNGAPSGGGAAWQFVDAANGRGHGPQGSMERPGEGKERAEKSGLARGAAVAGASRGMRETALSEATRGMQEAALPEATRGMREAALSEATRGIREAALPEETRGMQEAALPEAFRPGMTRRWTIGVIPGPHCTADYLQPHYLEQLTAAEWEVHFNSSRTGVRLVGPTPPWAREDGGEAGLHPSNIHDNAYAVGALDLTGDMPILLGPDGPSLGGFVCPVTTASAERWKLGQLRPGDKIAFRLLTLEEAEELSGKQERQLQAIRAGERDRLPDVSLPDASGERAVFSPDYPLLGSETEGRRFPIAIRCSGDENVLVEYGPMELDLKLRFQVHALMEAIRADGRIPALDLTPGIRSLQIHFDRMAMTIREVCGIVLELDLGLPPLESIRVPSRIVRLPLSWDDPATRLAIDRYQQNVRPDAPWCPSNLEFIRRVNGLAHIGEVEDIVFDASYLVLGLGDVYLGAPVATPVDPRHRLVTTKYNPARTWTPENAVGIGGAYMCVYGMEGPGGYQFVGRTIQMWNKLRSTASFAPGKPWLLRFFDQIRFYPVTADELLKLRDDFPRGRFEAEIEETTFDLGDYLRFLDSIAESAGRFKAKQAAAFRAERERWKEQGLAEYVSEQDAGGGREEDELPEGTVGVRCSMPGSIWKVLVEIGQRVGKGDVLMIEESMKMEFTQLSPCDGIVASVHVGPGDGVQAGQLIVGIATEPVREEAIV